MAYSRFKLAKVGSMTADIWLYTEFKENWQYFFNEPTMIPDAPGDVDKVQIVKAHTRRRGPGAPARNVAAHDRFYARIAKTKGSARPGKTYTIIEPGALGGVKEQRQFSILGNDMDVQAYAKNKAKFQVRIQGENGWSSLIQAASGQPTAVTP